MNPDTLRGSVGLVQLAWAPDSRHLVTTAALRLRATLWSCVDGGGAAVPGPKFAVTARAFRPGGDACLVVQRRENRDHVLLLGPPAEGADGGATNEWTVTRRWALATDDAAGFAWAPDGQRLCVWDSPMQYGVLLYSADGRRLHEPFAASPNALGVKRVAWSPGGELVAVGSYDEHVRVLSAATWRPVLDAAHPAVPLGPAGAMLFRQRAVGGGFDALELGVEGIVDGVQPCPDAIAALTHLACPSYLPCRVRCAINRCHRLPLTQRLDRNPQHARTAGGDGRTAG